jgi:DNA transformation protein and related proteins
MKQKPAFVQFIEEAFLPLEPRCKAMFGGWGVYVENRMIGLVANDVLYLKTDAHNRQMFLDAHLEPFVFQTEQKTVQMSYYRAPEDLLEDWEGIFPWVMGALQAAKRQEKPKGDSPHA